MAFCTNCGHQLSDGAKFCDECGTKVNRPSVSDENCSKERFDRETRKCPNCGELVEALTVVCPVCHYELRETIMTKCVTEFSHKPEQTEAAEKKQDYLVQDNQHEANTGKPKRKKAVIVTASLVLATALVALLIFGVIQWLDLRRVVPFSDDPAAISVASQSVVKLNCYDRRGDLCATGSGFACFADNIIVTNYHVIDGGVYRIDATTEDGQTFRVGYIVAMDKEKDIAILETYWPHKLALLQPGNSDDLQKGEKVVAIGSPLGLLNSISTGVFSGYTREDGMDVLQFTASISSGSSGGALFNDVGEVLGITYASYEAGQNLNLAIPIERVEHLWNNTTHTKMLVKRFYENNFPESMLTIPGDLGSEVSITAGNLQGVWKYVFDSVYDEILITLIFDGNLLIQRWDYVDGSFSQWEGPWCFVSKNQFVMTETTYIKYDAKTNATITKYWGETYFDPIDKLYENAMVMHGEYWYRQ